MTDRNSKKLAELVPKIMGAFHDLGRQHADDEKLSMRQFQALIIVHINDGLTVSEFCEKLKLAASTGTELANRMISQELFSKTSDSPDKRQVLLKLSEKGLDLLKKRQKAMTDMFDQFMQPFSSDDKILFVRSFQDIYSLITKYRPPHTP